MHVKVKETAWESEYVVRRRPGKCRMMRLLGLHLLHNTPFGINIQFNVVLDFLVDNK